MPSYSRLLRWPLVLILIPNIPIITIIEAAPVDPNSSNETYTPIASISNALNSSIPSTSTGFSNVPNGPQETSSISRLFGEQPTKFISRLSGQIDEPHPPPPPPSSSLHPEAVGAESTDPTDETPTKTDKRYGDTVGPQWFYQAKLAVECPSIQTIMTLDMSGIDRSLFPGAEDITLPFDYSVFPTAEQVYQFITDGIAQCKECDCLEDGEMIPGYFREADSVCATAGDVGVCQLVFGCYCSAVLVQRKPTSTSVTADDYQDALDQIPYSVRMDPRNRGYWWKNAPNNAQGRRAWMKAPPGSWPGTSYSRELVPGTKEPFWVEGRYSDPDWDLFAGGSGLWGFGGKGSIFKRDDVSPANLGSDGEVKATKTQPALEEE
ncbi:hypothetical protein TWF281_006061 [Arthrobotrys megalospora]